MLNHDPIRLHGDLAHRDHHDSHDDGDGHAHRAHDRRAHNDGYVARSRNSSDAPNTHSSAQLRLDGDPEWWHYRC
jgi:hypothetical protein